NVDGIVMAGRLEAVESHPRAEEGARSNRAHHIDHGSVVAPLGSDLACGRRSPTPIVDAPTVPQVMIPTSVHLPGLVEDVVHPRDQVAEVGILADVGAEPVV